MTTLAIAAALLLQTGAASPSQPARDTIPVRRDTIRLGRDTIPVPRDTARRGVIPPAPRVGRDTLRFPADTARPWRPQPQAPAGPLAPPAPPISEALSDTIFDTPGTRALVERTIRAGTVVPAELRDYRANMNAAIHLSLRTDSAQGGELPVTVDELAGEVRWERGGFEQTIRGHRVRQLSPTPYTVASALEAPWIVPHLYGNTIDAFSLSANNPRRTRVARAVHPFSWRGIDFYRYASGDPVRVRTSQGTVTLVPIEVRRRANVPDTARTVAGTFYVDVDRAAVARARFGFTDPGGGLLFGQSGTYFELENALVENRFWLPYRQRRELQFSAPLFGGAVAVRTVTAFTGYEVNTGWRPAEPGGRLVWALAPGDTVFRDWARTVGEAAGEADIADFGDLREAVRPVDPDAGPIRVAPGFERGDHFFRFNRVEGAYLGLGGRVQPRDPDRRTWSLYGTAGYAFAESAVRGEASVRLHPRPATPDAARWTFSATGYRRLRDTQAFRPSLEWDLGYTLSAALAGYDVRDYYDAAGGELQALRRRGPFSFRLGGRFERQDSVQRNTDSYFFGTASNFPLVAPADAGTHAAAEAELRFARGAGALSVGNSLMASLRGEAGFGDFRVQRLVALLSARRSGRYVTLVTRGDAGIVVGEAPPQFLFRFGGTEGLRGYDRNEFGGSTALLGRGRLLLHLPPYGNRPLYRSGLFVFPPLRAALVGSLDAGWSSVSDDSETSLLRLGARETDGARWSYGAGLSFFEDAVAIEHVWPGDGGEGKWYIGFVQWF